MLFRSGHVTRANYGIAMHIHVAETDEKARNQARPAHAVFHENFIRRYVEIGQADKYPLRLDFDQLVDDGKVLCGSPETVRRVLTRYLEQSRANYFLGSFAFGSMAFEQTRRSLELFAREVMPAFLP